MITVKRFQATWCGPCQVLKPIFNELKAEYPQINFEDIDVDSDPTQAQQFGIRSVPTVVILNNGAEVTRVTGAQNKNTYVQNFNNILA